MANSRRRTRVLILLLLLVAALGVSFVLQQYPELLYSMPEEPPIPTARRQAREPDPQYFPSNWVSRTSERPLRPDRRFTDAVSEVRRLLVGAGCESVDVTRAGDAWQVRCDETVAGSLPLRPRLSDGLGLLTAWAGALDPSVPGSSTVPDETFARIEAFDSASLLAALEALGAQWKRGERGMEISGAAATALTYFALQVADPFDLADPIRTRALAALAIAERAAGGPGDHLRALLAWHLGYALEAREYAAALPLDSVFRAFVESDLERLGSLSAAEDSPMSARFLFAQQILWRQPERTTEALALFSHPSQALAWHSLQRQDWDIVTARGLASFAIPYLTVALRAQRGDAAAIELFARDDLRPPEPASQGSLGEILALRLRVGRGLSWIEAELASGLERAPSGVFAEGVQDRAFLAAYVGATWDTFLLLRDLLATQSGVDRFADALGTVERAELVQLAALIRASVGWEKGGDALASAPRVVTSTSLLGPEAVAQIGLGVRAADPFADPRMPDYLQALLEHLDTRPAGLGVLASVVYWDFKASLRRAGASEQGLMNLALGLQDRGRAQAAFDILSGFPVGHWSDHLFSILAYDSLEAVEGTAAALDWLRSRVPAGHLDPFSMFAYHYGAFDVLWEVVRNDNDDDYVWLMRAADWVENDRSHDDRGRRLREWFARPEGSHYHQLGRMLLGLEDPDAVDRLATGSDNTAEIAYFRGLLEQSRGNEREAARWYRVVVATGRTSEGEYPWARSRLEALWSRHRPPEASMGDEERDPI
jgi:hypothetical protein